ncbi:ParA family protein [Acetobacter thailandicus]|uniref:ParA family protein n=1 Tax=Acetobacter thailandicus TaxID=1502842 RepID=UPI001BAD2243|nr:AAA family ATPase [Acetobacter thailandicus]MBS0961234.1 ParA family protein [Acetobacter thailandicus]
MNAQKFRTHRLTLRLSQGEIKDELNRRLGRSYDKPKISRWENEKEPIPDDVSEILEKMISTRKQSARVLVLANQKGGVGKTTSSLNLAYGLASIGCRVLLIDMDPQATATAGILATFNADLYNQGKTIAHVILHDKPLEQVIIKAGNLPDGRKLDFDFVSSHIDLAETDGRREPGYDAALREAIEPIQNNYDWIVVDAPPNLGMLTWMSLAAADEVIVPVRTEPYDTMGVGLIIGTIGKIQRRLNPSLHLSGVLPTQYNSRKSVDREVLLHLCNMLKDRAPVLGAVPSSAAYGHAARAARIALEASPSSPATTPYLRLAQALNARSELPLTAVEKLEVTVR